MWKKVRSCGHADDSDSDSDDEELFAATANKVVASVDLEYKGEEEETGTSPR